MRARSVSPDNVRNQFEGAAVSEHSLALFGEITATNGVIDQKQLQQLPARAHEPCSTARRRADCEEREPPAGVGDPACRHSPPAL